MRRLLPAALVLIAVGAAWAQDVRDYPYFVKQCIDLDALPLLEDGTTCKQFSSYDRRSHDPKFWDANGDAGQYIQYDPDLHGPPLKEGEALMAQMDGPGCIFRIWSANPKGLIRFYLDGATEHTYEFEFDKLFRGEYEDFKPPFVYKRGGQQSASDCYLPIPYAKSCRVTADKRHGQYYHIGYMTYPSDTAVETFKWPLGEEAKQAAAEVAAKWTNCGTDPRPSAPGDATIQKTVTLEPWKPLTLADLEGPAMIKTLKAKLTGDERYIWRKVLLRIWFDDERQASVICPLGEFFGTGWQANEYRSYPLGVIDGEGYSFWAMPVHKRAKVQVVHRGTAPVSLEFTLKWQKLDLLPANAAVFHAKWRREAPCKIFDYPFLEARGPGRFVGVALYIDHPVPGWWGEGDEKVWVDGEDFPSTFGTGSEDYFGDAWGIRDLHQPSFGCNLRQATRTCCYRWHIADHIPFAESYRMTIENYAPFADDYTSVAYWYQTPGGPDFFHSETADDWRPWGRSMPYTLEAEDIWLDRLNGVLKPIADEGLPYEYSHGLAVDFGYRNPTDKTPDGTIEIAQRDAYYPTVYTVVTEHGREVALFELVIDGMTLKPLDDRRREGWITFEGAYLPAGPHTIALRFIEDGPVGIDCLKLDPSPKVRDALEAEQLTPVKIERGTADVEMARLRWSHGKQLVFLATEEGASLALELPGEDAVDANLTAQITTGPDYGDVRFKWLGQEVGGVISCYSDKPGLRTVALGKIALPAADRLLVAEVVGKHDDSTGYRVGIDYIMLEEILYPGAIEAETAKVLKAQGGGTSVQRNAGMSGLSGHAQLFFTNQDKDGFVELEFSVPGEGDYEASAWFTHSHDYATVQVSVDGKKLGSATDIYNPNWTHGGETTLGGIHLKPGKHVIRFQSVGKNKQSKGYFMGIDCFRLQPK